MNEDAMKLYEYELVSIQKNKTKPMTSEEIKTEVAELFAQRDEALIRIQNLQDICNHENTHIGVYSWRVGCYDDAVICSDCLKMLNYVNDLGAKSNL